MPVPSVSQLALAVVLVTGATAFAQPRSAAEAGLRRIELHADAAGAEPEIHISPGISTVLTFDVKLARQPTATLLVELERAAAFTRMELGDSVLRLVPSDALKAGEQLRLTVRFEDGAAPPKATFVLRVRVNQADRLVEVYREPRSVESYQQEVGEAWGAVRQCQEALAKTQAMPDSLTGLTALGVSGILDDTGVVTRDLPQVAAQVSGGAFTVKQLRTYRTRRRVLMELSLRASQPGAPWTAREASLTGRRGEFLKVVSVWQGLPVTASRPGWVLVEAESDEFVSPESWTLRLSEEGSGRAVVVDGISFAPVLQKEERR